MMQSRPGGLFGRKAFPIAGMPMPGPISGYGGGTRNVDGTQATPVNGMGETPAPVFQPSGNGASAMGWPMPDSGSLPQLPSKPRGIFGSQPFAPPALPDSGDGQPSWSASAMGTLGDAAGLPRRSTGFDYESALASMLPERKKRSTLEKIATFAAPILMSLGGNQAGANAFTQHRLAQRQDRDKQRTTALSTIERWRHDDYARQQGADLRASAPRVIGRSMVQYDPQGGTVDELYDGPEDFENYAETLGLEPGSQEYFDAVEDYVLKSDGPAAYERDRGLDDYRTGNRLKLEGARQGNRVGLEGIRQQNRVTTRGLPTYRDTQPRAAGGSKRPTATGPNGAKVEWDGKAWVPAR